MNGADFIGNQRLGTSAIGISVFSSNAKNRGSLNVDRSDTIS